MPKILILIPDDYAAGGLQRSAVALRDCLVSGGHEVIIHTIRTSPGGLTTSHDYAHRVQPEDASGMIGWVGFVRDLRRLLKREVPHATIGFGLVPAVLVAAAGAGLSGMRIGSERAYPPLVEGKRLYSVVRKLFFPRLDTVVCQTSGIAQWFEKALRIDPSRIAVIPNVVRSPPPGWVPARYGSGGNKARTFVSVGRLDRQKGFDMALHAFVAIAASDPAARLRIIGEGPLGQELRDLRAELGLETRVEFDPPTTDIAAVWREAYALLFTSRYEGFPNVLAEAMAHGVPAVAFDCPTGPADLIHDGEDGFLVPLGDIDAAAERSIELLRDPAKRDRLGAAAMVVSRTFSFERVADMWNSLMKRAPHSPVLARANSLERSSPLRDR